jgi:hypothetical protein
MKEVKEKLLGPLLLNAQRMLNRDSKRMLLKKREVSSVSTLICSLMNERKSLRTIAYAAGLLDSY